MRDRTSRWRKGSHSPAGMRAGAALLVLLLMNPTLAAHAQGSPETGGGAGASWEARFRALPSPENMREYMQRLSARPHHIGSAHGKENAEWLLAKFREWGWEAEIETYEILFPTPKERILELVAPTRYTARLREPEVAGDPTSQQHGEYLPPYNAYSIDGDVTAPLVYVNYGVPEDYERLERLGVSVRGAVVIARYGASWRGIKPKVAAEHGAVGCIIYSDPRDDGYVQGDVYPQGAWRPPEGVQRGSVMDMPLHPGDPLTPGVGATAGASRLERGQAQVFTKIPVLPISYADAQPLLAALGGPVAPPEWRGGLGITYHVGPGPARVRLKVESNWEMKPVHNVIARMPGAELPDEWVIRGNHHDAWVSGAQDPVSGLVAMLEEARALGELRRQGWRPKRTIVYAAWDGEEAGLIGSTEWAEHHAEELRRRAVAYINTDSTGRGYLNVSGSHSLEAFINDVAKEVEDPDKGISLWKREQLRRISRASSAEEREGLRRATVLTIEALGSGSDYTAFLDHLGIASLHLSFGGESGGGIYHSAYDSFHWWTQFNDSTFAYGRALAQTAGTAAMRLADAEVLPFQFTGLANTVRRYVTEIERLAESQREAIRERNRQIEEGVFAAVTDSRQPEVPPAREDVPPYLNFAPLKNAVETLSRAADRYQRAAARRRSGAPMAAGTLAEVNRELIASERSLTDADGLPGRPWYRHQLYAPGFYTGYGVKTIPAVREAVEQKQWDVVEQSVSRVARVLENAAAVIERAATGLERDTR